MIDPRVEQYAKLLVERSVDVQPGWQVVVIGSTQARPLVATESLWGVALSLLFIRRSERIGRPVVLGALVIVAGSALIGVFR